MTLEEIVYEYHALIQKLKEQKAEVSKTKKEIVELLKKWSK